MTILYKDENTGIEAGINDDGDLFLGDKKSGYNLHDTPYNRRYVERDFVKYTGKTLEYGKSWRKRGFKKEDIVLTDDSKSKSCTYSAYPNNEVCRECSKRYDMPYPYCCLDECGEHEFCRDCANGVYKQN